MKRFITNSLLVLAVCCCIAVTGCGGQALSTDFSEEAVRQAAEDVISLINTQDREGLRQICTVQMKNALTDDVFDEIFTTIAEGGRFVSIQDMHLSGASDSSSGEDFAVVVAKAEYEIKRFVYTISFTRQMKLAGLYYR